MTKSEKDAQAGRAAKEYAENEESIAHLRERCRAIGAGMEALAGRLKARPEEIEITEDGLRPSQRESVPPITDAAWDEESVRETLRDLGSALGRKGELEQKLASFGLAALIRRP